MDNNPLDVIEYKLSRAGKFMHTLVETEEIPLVYRDGAYTLSEDKPSRITVLQAILLGEDAVNLDQLHDAACMLRVHTEWLAGFLAGIRFHHELIKKG